MSDDTIQTFLDALGKLESDMDGDRAALEWTRQGTSRDGDEIEYPGVSVLELSDGRIVRFTAYFHPRELGRQAI